MTNTNEDPVARRARLAHEMSELIERVGDRPMTDGEATRFRSLETGITAIDAAAWTRQEKITAIERGLADGTVVAVSGDGAAATGTSRDVYLNRRAGADPWAADDAVFGRDREASLRFRAEACIERVALGDVVRQDDTRQRATKILEALAAEGDSSVAEWAVAVSNPVYERAFKKILNNPQSWSAMLSDEERAAFQATQTRPIAQMARGNVGERAAMSLTNANGGFMVPFTLDPTIILTNVGAIDPFREICTIKTIATDNWNGITSAGVNAEWLAEATEVADASPTVGQPSITVHKASAYIQASFEVNQDSNIGDQIGELIADAKARLESDAFATGTGSGQPFGIVTELNLVTASRVAGSSGAAGAADFVLADVYALDNALPSRYRRDPVWVGHISTLNKARRFGEGTTGSNSAYWADLGTGTPSTLLGHSVYESSAMDSTIVSGSNDNVLILGNFKSGYFIVDRIGLSIAYNPLVLGSNRRPTGEVGWFAHWRTGGACVNADAFRMLRL